MNIIENEKVVLRDFMESDISKRMYWETEANEWQLWDGPWEYEGKSEEVLQEERQEYLASLKKRAATPLKKEQLRTRFEIVEKETGEYIGWIGTYHIDEDCLINDEGTRLAIGLSLPEISVRGKGLGTSALTLAMDYFFQNGYDEIYTQTWSGNKPMQMLAAKLGFEEICRKKDFRLVRGETYDGLTFCKKRDSDKSMT